MKKVILSLLIFVLPLQKTLAKALTVQDLVNNKSKFNFIYVLDVVGNKEKIKFLQSKVNELQKREGFKGYCYSDYGQFSGGYGSGSLCRYLNCQLNKNNAEDRRILQLAKKYQSYLPKKDRLRVFRSKNEDIITKEEANNWMLLIDFDMYYLQTHTLFIDILADHYWNSNDNIDSDMIAKKALQSLGSHVVFDFVARVNTTLVIYNVGRGNYKNACEQEYFKFLNTKPKKRNVKGLEKCTLSLHKGFNIIKTHREQDIVHLARL
jgi:hypothetical protein